MKDETQDSFILHPSTFILADKPSLRRQLLARRQSLSPTERAYANQLILHRVTGSAWFAAADVVLLYASLAAEVDTWPLMKEVLRRGKKLLLPRVDGRELTLWTITDLEGQLVAVPPYNIREPNPELCQPADPATVGLASLPGVGFDPEGWRIGFGAGFYDRLLPALPLTARRVGLAYQLQMVPQLPHGGNDVPVQAVITEEMAYWPRHKVIETHTEAETEQLGARFAALVPEGSVIALEGALGSGKTVFCRGFLHARGVAGPVTSPTFILVHTYPTEPPCYHVDAFRYHEWASPERVEELLQVFESGGLVLVEWANQVLEQVPLEAIWLSFETTATGSRRITIRCCREGDAEWMERV